MVQQQLETMLVLYLKKLCCPLLIQLEHCGMLREHQCLSHTANMAMNILRAFYVEGSLMLLLIPIITHFFSINAGISQGSLNFQYFSNHPWNIVPMYQEATLRIFSFSVLFRESSLASPTIQVYGEQLKKNLYRLC